VSKAIYCDCGLVCRGDSDEELLREAERHLRDEHPGLAGQVRPEDLLAMAVEIAPEAVADDPQESEGPLVVRRSGAIATVILNRPNRRNALSLDLITRLRGELSALGDDAGVRAIIVAGAGSVFCSGHDLAEMRGIDEAACRELFDADSGLMKDLHHLPQPVVARVQGPASAGGCHLVAACDFAVASPEATFAVPGPVLGLVGTTAMVEVARVIGRRRAMQMLMSGAPISAETALSWGMVNAVVPAGELVAASLAMATSASAGAPGTAAVAKRALYDNLDLSLDEAYAHASEVTWRTVPGADAQEGISAFLDKRRPAWRRDGPGA
jgi:enoyl-CoA hydratase/carnithine racemase/predicted small metal-binding protein